MQDIPIMITLNFKKPTKGLLSIWSLLLFAGCNEQKTEDMSNINLVSSWVHTTIEHNVSQDSKGAIRNVNLRASFRIDSKALPSLNELNRISLFVGTEKKLVFIAVKTMTMLCYICVMVSGGITMI